MTTACEKFGAEPTALTAENFTRHMLDDATGARPQIMSALADWEVGESIPYGPWALQAAADNLRTLAAILDEVAAARISEIREEEAA